MSTAVLEVNKIKRKKLKSRAQGAVMNIPILKADKNDLCIQLEQKVSELCFLTFVLFFLSAAITCALFALLIPQYFLNL